MWDAVLEHGARLLAPLAVYTSPLEVVGTFASLLEGRFGTGITPCVVAQLRLVEGALSAYFIQ